MAWQVFTINVKNMLVNYLYIFANNFLFLDASNNNELNASIGLENDDDLFVWNVIFEGPEDTLYEGGYFKA